MHTIEIIDVVGNVVSAASWQHERGAASYTMPINAGVLASGTYNVVLTTPTRRRQVPLHIIH